MGNMCVCAKEKIDIVKNEIRTLLRKVSQIEELVFTNDKHKENCNENDKKY